MLKHCTANLVRALGQNTKVLKFLGNPKGDEMDMKVLDFEHFLSMLHTGTTNKDQGSYEDQVKGRHVLDKDGNGTIMGGEICHVPVWMR
jgi:myosin light chain 6